MNALPHVLHGYNGLSCLIGVLVLWWWLKCRGSMTAEPFFGLPQLLFDTGEREEPPPRDGTIIVVTVYSKGIQLDKAVGHKCKMTSSRGPQDHVCG